MKLAQVKSDLIAATKARDALTVSVLRLLLSAIHYRQIDLHRPLTAGEVVEEVLAEVGKRREAMAAFAAAGRREQADKEQKELAILEGYLRP